MAPGEHRLVARIGVGIEAEVPPFTKISRDVVGGEGYGFAEGRDRIGYRTRPVVADHEGQHQGEHSYSLQAHICITPEPPQCSPANRYFYSLFRALVARIFFDRGLVFARHTVSPRSPKNEHLQ